MVGPSVTLVIRRDICVVHRSSTQEVAVKSVVRLHSVTRPSGPKRTKRISHPVRFISEVPYMADRDIRDRLSI